LIILFRRRDPKQKNVRRIVVDAVADDNGPVVPDRDPLLGQKVDDQA